MVSPTQDRTVVAFGGSRLIGEGTLSAVLPSVKQHVARGAAGPVLVFDATTSEPIEVDLRDPVDAAAAERSSAPPTIDDSSPSSSSAQAAQVPVPDAPRGPGRPRLGVVSREVTLLPRHWDWLALQPGGASAALRRLVEQARSTHAGRDRVRAAQESAYRFMSAMLGDYPGFEEATRALFAGDRDRFTTQSEGWPPDLRDHARRLAHASFST